MKTRHIVVILLAYWVAIVSLVYVAVREVRHQGLKAVIMRVWEGEKK